MIIFIPLFLPRPGDDPPGPPSAGEKVALGCVWAGLGLAALMLLYLAYLACGGRDVVWDWVYGPRPAPLTPAK